ncbi:hypothetical protein [Mycoplasma elephantis]|uniref:hypothetical protein n=1 Tax=Mycoplasma elephantis TaxID=114882 RepID=UPI00056B58E5|nr:hypothetical protein [Mycoplasma elephantis]
MATKTTKTTKTAKVTKPKTTTKRASTSERWYCTLRDGGHHKDFWVLKPANKEPIDEFDNIGDAVDAFKKLNITGTLWFQKGGKYIRTIRSLRSEDGFEQVIVDSEDDEETKKQNEKRMKEIKKAHASLVLVKKENKPIEDEIIEEKTETEEPIEEPQTEEVVEEKLETEEQENIKEPDTEEVIEEKTQDTNEVKTSEETSTEKTLPEESENNDDKTPSVTKEPEKQSPLSLEERVSILEKETREFSHSMHSLRIHNIENKTGAGLKFLIAFFIILTIIMIAVLACLIVDHYYPFIDDLINKFFK